MTRFSEAFIFLAGSGAEPHAREGELSRTAFVPVESAEAAVAAARELRAGGLDLVELYAGLGPTAAAAVFDAIGGEAPVGMVGVEEGAPVHDRAIIFAPYGADPDGERYIFEHAGGRMTIAGVTGPDAVPATAVELADAGAERIEICGGLGALPAAAAIAALDGAVPVAAVAFGFESLPGAAGYRARFERTVEAHLRPKSNISV